MLKNRNILQNIYTCICYKIEINDKSSFMSFQTQLVDRQEKERDYLTSNLDGYKSFTIT